MFKRTKMYAMGGVKGRKYAANGGGMKRTKYASGMGANKRTNYASFNFSCSS